ncbi:MAG: hypothetical protein QY331_02190 [Melioribacteraceae bacterium]|nr:hypothetical protein [Melioribacteraceae bacterium]WKZ70063.1 MAG: hypothetical protein QY331_02190 [Melioribacteraceae bacterium]
MTVVELGSQIFISSNYNCEFDNILNSSTISEISTELLSERPCGLYRALSQEPVSEEDDKGISTYCH